MDEFNRVRHVSRSGNARIGPGGMHCRCCGCPDATKTTRRRMKQIDKVHFDSDDVIEEFCRSKYPDNAGSDFEIINRENRLQLDAWWDECS